MPVYHGEVHTDYEQFRNTRCTCLDCVRGNVNPRRVPVKPESTPTLTDTDPATALKQPDACKASSALEVQPLKARLLSPVTLGHEHEHEEE